MQLPRQWTVIARNRTGQWTPTEKAILSVRDAKRLADQGYIIMANRRVPTGDGETTTELVVKQSLHAPSRRPKP